MAKEHVRRKSSIPSFIYGGQDSLQVEETDLRWRRNSQAALASILPSHGSFHSDMGLVLERTMKDPHRRKSVALRRRSVAAIRDTVTMRGETDSCPTIRKLLKGMSAVDQWLAAEEERQTVVESIRSMTASLTVKKKYRYILPNPNSKEQKCLIH